ncbi:MAG: exodeoxyribonuclease VII large subunit, partial [Alphaproteobacteria bacterium]|nr:exodeoxyribonuclease VII large subunit [Alphaproteobacteria bacterium]
FNRLDEISEYDKPDVLIVARGGGSLEDLWAFNEECVIRAVFASQIPIISAVGHETDTMLIDYVADKRAPTPTGAAEFAVPVRAELQANLNNLEARLKNSKIRYFSELNNILSGLARGIPNLEQILQEATQKFDDRIERLHNAFKNFIQNKFNQIELCTIKPFYIKTILDKKQEALNHLTLRLSSVSVESVLKRGFAWVKNDKDKTVYLAKDTPKNSRLKIKFADGSIDVYTDEKHIEAYVKKETKTVKKEKTNNEKQISLFDI